MGFDCIWSWMVMVNYCRTARKVESIISWGSFEQSILFRSSSSLCFNRGRGIVGFCTSSLAIFFCSFLWLFKTTGSSVLRGLDSLLPPSYSTLEFHLDLRPCVYVCSCLPSACLLCPYPCLEQRAYISPFPLRPFGFCNPIPCCRARMPGSIVVLTMATNGCSV